MNECLRMEYMQCSRIARHVSKHKTANMDKKHTRRLMNILSMHMILLSVHQFLVFLVIASRRDRMQLYLCHSTPTERKGAGIPAFEEFMRSFIFMRIATDSGDKGISATRFYASPFQLDGERAVQRYEGRLVSKHNVCIN